MIYHLIHHAVLKRNFLEFSSDSLMSNHLLISEMLLRRSAFPSCRERTIKFRFHSQLSYFQQDLKLDNLDYSIRICHQLSSRSRPLWLHKVSEERSSLEKYVEYNWHRTNVESIVQVLFCVFVLGNQQVASNDCITDTMRYSVWHAGLLFCTGFELNGKQG